MKIATLIIVVIAVAAIGYQLLSHAALVTAFAQNGETFVEQETKALEGR